MWKLRSSVTIRNHLILVIEFGYCGTIPLTLSALDDRIWERAAGEVLSLQHSLHPGQASG